MKKIFTLIIISAFLLSCKKDKKKDVLIRPKNVSTTIAQGLDIKDIEFDPNGDLYILTNNSVKKLSNGNLTTLSLPDTVFSMLKTPDEETDLGYPKEIAIDKTGIIYLGSNSGVRIIFKNNSFITGGREYIGWTVDGLNDLVVDKNDRPYFSGVNNPLTRFDVSGVIPLSADTISILHCVDICASGIFFGGSDRGIVRMVLGVTDDFLIPTFLGNPNNLLKEGPVDEVIIGKVYQIEVSSDGNLIYFIEDGKLKELKKGIVKIIMPLANTVKIALSNDNKKLYYAENNDLKVLEL